MPSGSVSPRIVLFDLYAGGHHAQYVECLLAYWAQQRPDADIHVIVSDRFAGAHPGMGRMAADTPRAELHVVEAPDDFDRVLTQPVARDRLHGKLISRYARELRPDHFLLMYFDHSQLSLAVDLRFAWDIRISGIYFRPTFHYHSYQDGTRRSPADRAKAATKQVVLRAALRNRHLRTIFSLDPFAVPYIEGWSRHTEVVALPEPLVLGSEGPRAPVVDPARTSRRRLIMFGVLDERKGIDPVVDALLGLSREGQAKLELILAGRVTGPQRPELLSRIGELEARTDVAVRLDDRFVPEDEIQPLLAGGDLVLLTYQQQHVGSSGVLVRAAAARVPVLAAERGLMGELVRCHRLGLTVDATRAESIRAALQDWLDQPETLPFDPEAASTFASGNTADAFAETIFSRLLSPTASPPAAE